MPINRLYHTWIRRIRELRPEQRITQVRGFVGLLVGIFASRSVNLSRVAGKIPGQAVLVSVTRRLSRLLANAAIDVRGWYEPIARQWITMQATRLQQIRLIVDGSKVGFAHQLLIVSLAYRRRAIPIAWCCCSSDPFPQAFARFMKVSAIWSIVKIAGICPFSRSDCA